MCNLCSNLLKFFQIDPDTASEGIFRGPTSVVRKKYSHDVRNRAVYFYLLVSSASIFNIACSALKFKCHPFGLKIESFDTDFDSACI